MKNKIILEITAIALLVMVSPSLVSAATLNRQLELGMSGSDVSSLQTFLAGDPTIYPQGLVTGYFGSLTKSAVSNFQAANGISTVGRVGPTTLAAINEQMAGGVSSGRDVRSPSISDIRISATPNSANVSWNTNQAARGVVYYSNSPLKTYERPNSVDVLSGFKVIADTSARYAQSVTLSGLQSNTTYYYLIYATDQSGNVSVFGPGHGPATFHTNF
ncbi:MAG: peptidoglycan-binding protein [bacterium]